MATLPKKTFRYSEADEGKPDLFLEKIKNIDTSNIVYSNETGIDDNEVVLTGLAPRGKRCYAQKKTECKKRYNITAALNLNSLFAPFIFEGYSNTLVYETYVEQILVPSLRLGMILVIDNASKKLLNSLNLSLARSNFCLHTLQILIRSSTCLKSQWGIQAIFNNFSAFDL